MPQDNRHVGLTPEEISLRGRLGQLKRWGRPTEEIRAAELRYHLAVARRKAAEFADKAQRLERELERVA